MAELEDIKRNSHHLRGTILENLQKDTTHFDEADANLLKFHGSYQQDDRDLRNERRRQDQEKAYMFMVRSKIPGGRLTAEQYLVHDQVAGDLANGTLRITSRSGFQMHGVLKGNLRQVIARINRSGITTWGGCGDVVRNVMATPVPLDTPVHREVQALAYEFAKTFAARNRAYSELWLDGQKLALGDGPDETDPIYGDAYLPRKFKIGVVIPPNNDIDVYSHDLGFVAHAPDGRLEGFTVLVGGGFGMTYNRTKTWPALAKPLFYIRKQDALATAIAVVTTQRDYGNREDRKQARLKYLLDSRGLDWFRNEVLSRMPGIRTEPPRTVTWTSMEDPLGWHEQGDGRLFCGVFVENGRIKDDGPRRYRNGFRTLVRRFGCPVHLTGNQNILFCDVAPADRAEFDGILREYGIAASNAFTRAHRLSIACVALPTCGLALSESERVFRPLMERIDEVLRELRLQDEPILFRMTGCPNGCARPYNADFGFVGRGPEKYAVFVGGSHTGDRMAGLYEKSVNIDEIPALVRGLLDEFVANRRDGETFTHYWGRTHTNGPEPHPDQFHVELRERQARPAGRQGATTTAADA